MVHGMLTGQREAFGATVVNTCVLEDPMVMVKMIKCVLQALQCAFVE